MPKLSLASVSQSTPLCSPRPSRSFFDITTPPPPPNRAPEPPLLQALQANSYEQLREALEREPEAAELPFFDHEFEPPLCCAVRLGCSADLIDLLLQHGAQVDAVDVRGRTPLQILSLTPVERCCLAAFPAPLEQGSRSSRKQQSLDIACLLLAAGCDPLGEGASQHVMRASCLECARSAGNLHLEPFFLGYDDQKPFS